MIIKFREIHYSFDLFLWKLIQVLLVCIFESIFYICILCPFIYSNVPPLLLSVGIYSRLYPGSWIEIMGVLFSLIRDSEVLKKGKLSLFSVRIVENSSKWWGRKEIFKWKNDKLKVCLFISVDISLGSKYLLATR